MSVAGDIADTADRTTSNLARAGLLLMVVSGLTPACWYAGLAVGAYGAIAVQEPVREAFNLFLILLSPVALGYGSVAGLIVGLASRRMRGTRKVMTAVAVVLGLWVAVWFAVFMLGGFGDQVWWQTPLASWGLLTMLVPSLALPSFVAGDRPRSVGQCVCFGALAAVVGVLCYVTAGFLMGAETD